MTKLFRLAFGILYGSLAVVLGDSSFRQKPAQSILQHSFESASPAIDDPLLEIHRELIKIRSITGNEYEIGNWLANFFKEHNFTVEKQEVEEKRFNILAYPEGVENGKSRILVTSHIDTVPPYIPYSIDDSSKTIWGRGSVDAKASVAAQIVAAINLLTSFTHEIPQDALSLLFVVGEESKGDGMRHFSSHAPHNYSAVIFGEPTEGRLACGHKGILAFKIRTGGKAAHSGYPWLGVNANIPLIKALAKLLALEPKLPSDENYGLSTLNIGRIEGGAAANVVPEAAEAQVSIRLAGGTPEKVREMIEDALKEVREEARQDGGTFDIEWWPNRYPPMKMECDVKGFETISVNYGTDVPNLQGEHKRYLYGPGSIFVAHGAREHLLVSDLVDAVGAYETLIVHALRETEE